MVKGIQYKVHILQTKVKEIYEQSTNMKMFAMNIQMTELMLTQKFNYAMCMSSVITNSYR